MTALSSSAAELSGSVAGRLGGCITPDSERLVEPPPTPHPDIPRTPAELLAAQRQAIAAQREFNAHLGEHLDGCTILRPRELAELCEKSRVHKFKVHIRWHPDGTAALPDDSPDWAVEWLWTYRENHP